MSCILYIIYYINFCLIYWPEALSEAVKLLKAEYLVAAIDKLSVDQAIIFCRTKLDCDHIEEYLTSLGGTFTNRLLTRLLNTALQIS